MAEMDVMEKLVELLNGVLTTEDVTSSKEVADHLIANGVTMQKHGHWKILGQRTYGGGRCYTHYCSECGQHGFDDYKFCPNCIAKMDGDVT
jgi:hypothetical protein